MKLRKSSRRATTVNGLVEAYMANQHLVAQFQSQLMTSLQGSKNLMEHVHSMKSRLKDPDHLRDKIKRKRADLRREGKILDITPENLLTRITDLAGIRILHLYTRQIAKLDQALRGIFEEQRFSLLEGPFARTWDDESRAYFKECGIDTQQSPSMYTSVHYVVGSASRTMITCEIQVRTLMEEVWGEVDHAMNYPYRVESLACREQLKVLARVTSGATRLVDSIFATFDDHNRSRGKNIQSVTGAAAKRR
jgi:putative GTP pyrophosphokinase